MACCSAFTAHNRSATLTCSGPRHTPTTATRSRPLLFDGINRQASSSPNQNEFDALAETGTTVALGSWMLRPLIGLQYLHLYQGAFTEGGANSLNLTMNGQGTDALFSSAGLRFGRVFYADSCTIIPLLHTRIIHDMIGEDRLIAGSLSGAGGSFAVEVAHRPKLPGDRHHGFRRPGQQCPLARRLQLPDWLLQGNNRTRLAGDLKCGGRASMNGGCWASNTTRRLHLDRPMGSNSFRAYAKPPGWMSSTLE